MEIASPCLPISPSGASLGESALCNLKAHQLNMAETMLAQAAYIGTGKHPGEPQQKPQQEAEP
ncbi:hypothetical protein [Microseira sp. BLCC-F43]|uniref:hypothetical protein n=1 Tax=Microseira sp. BLCC-F43 TaxID=3153602 RepID=UPI0035B7F326